MFHIFIIHFDANIRHVFLNNVTIRHIFSKIIYLLVNNSLYEAKIGINAKWH